MASLEGQLLAGKYRVERVLGEGGMGVVVAAVHRDLDQRVALKFLVPSALENEEAVGRFVREARSAVRLTSEHVARVIDVGTLENGAPFIVMEYLDGSDLADVVSKSGPLPISEAVDYVLQACEAIAEAHASGIVHRDLKPANLFLTRRRDGTACVKVLDFGIAKIAGKSGDPSLTQPTGSIGTPFYMSPEQMRSAKSADCRSDIWSLGIILFELLSGKLAFGQETLPELCTAILNDPPSSLRALRPDISARLEGVVLTCLEKDPDRRFQDMGELGRALCPFASPQARGSAERIRRILDSSDATQPSSPLPTVPSSDEPTLLDLREAESHTEEPTMPVVPRRSVKIWMLAMACMALFGAGVIVFWQHTQPSTERAEPLAAHPTKDMAPVASVVVAPARSVEASPAASEVVVPPFRTVARPALVPAPPRRIVRRPPVAPPNASENALIPGDYGDRK